MAMDMMVTVKMDMLGTVTWILYRVCQGHGYAGNCLHE